MNAILRRLRFALQTLLSRILARFTTQVISQALAWMVGQEFISPDEQNLLIRFIPHIVALAGVEIVFTSLEWLWRRKELSFLHSIVDAMTTRLEEEQRNTEIALTLDAGASRADIEETRRLANQHGFKLPVTRIPGTEDNQ